MAGDPLSLVLTTQDGSAITELRPGDVVVYSRSEYTVAVLRDGAQLTWKQGDDQGSKISWESMALSGEQIRTIFGFAAALCGMRLKTVRLAPVGESRFRVEA